MKLAVIGTFYERRDRTQPLIQRVMSQSTRPPDEFWVMCESDLDAAAAVGFSDPRIRVVVLPTPRDGSGYAVIPYSNKINYALDRTEADAIAYLDNGSLPSVEKYGAMLEGLEAHPEWGAVYCGQHRTGYREQTLDATEVVEDAYCVLNYTQVMHRPTADRWPLDMKLALPADLADAEFWRALHRNLGAFHPIAGILDEHHIPSPKAVGL